MGASGRLVRGILCLALVGACGRPDDSDGTLAKTGELGAASRTSWTAVAMPLGAQQPTNVVAGATLATIRVAITDSGNNVVPSTLAVTLSVSGNAAPLEGTQTATAVNGVATFSDVVISKAGTFRLIAAAPGMTSATSVAFTVAPSTLHHLEFTVQPGNVAAGAAIAPAVQVSALDAYGNPVNTPQTLVVSLFNNPGSATMTPVTVNTSTGRATYAALKVNRLGVGYTLQASCAGLPTITSAAFDVSLGAATKLVVISGSGQSVNVAAAPPFPLVIESQDIAGNVVPGVSVTWVAVTGGGSVTLSNPVTNALGRAQASVLMGTLAGAQRFEAQGVGLTSAVFTLTGKALAPTQFTLASGDGQTGVAGSALPGLLVAKVADQYGNGVVNQTVTFAATSGGGSVSVPLKTDAAGNASVTATLGTFAGVNTYTATRAGLPGSPVTFTATGTPGGPAQAVFSVQPSATVVATTLAPVTVRVTDANGNAISGAQVSLAVAGGAAGAVLSGTLAQTTAGGDAVFADLAVSQLGAAFALTATVGPVTVASSSFDVTCASGLTACGGQCLDATTDVANCGACAHSCAGSGATGVTCVAGVCQVASCQAGKGDCDSSAANGCETNVAVSPQNCGACGRVCPSGVMCVQGMCGSDDAAASFTQPASPWTYGSIPDGSLNAFTKFSSTYTDSEGNTVWHGASDTAVVFNGTGATTAAFGGAIPSQAVALVPGNGEAAVLRYTAEATGKFRASLKFEGLVDTTETQSFTETRYHTVQLCRYGIWPFCGGLDPAWHNDQVYCGTCGSQMYPNTGDQQTTTRTFPVRATPLIQVRVNGQSAWGPTNLNDQTQYESFGFSWNESWRYYVGGATHHYWRAYGDNAQQGTLALDLVAGDVVDIVVAPGRASSSASSPASHDLTQVSARLELACASGWADCDGNASNGCEVELATQGGTCDRSLVSVSAAGLEGNATSSQASVSNDGKFVAFVSSASNLTSGTTGNVLLADRQTGLIEVVATNGSSPHLTSDGRWVVFESSANNLVPGDHNNQNDIFVFDRQAKTVERVSD